MSVYRGLPNNSTIKLLCHFVVYALKPLNTFSVAFQTRASRIGTMQADVRKLLHSFVSNFVEPEVVRSADDITAIGYIKPVE